jgi:hypothetical protein
VILVLAHAGDEIARRLAARLAATVVTARDLSTRGWRHAPLGGPGGGVDDDVLGLAGGPVAATAVRGVVTRMGAVTPPDLGHIAEADRSYVAAEMTAFLLSLLHALPCPVVNRPTPMSLMGPGWTAMRWRAAAIAAGVAVAPDGAGPGDDEVGASVPMVGRGVPPYAPAGTSITVLGDRWFGPDALAPAALALARHARLELLTARFTADAALVDADPWAELPDAAADALRARLA